MSDVELLFFGNRLAFSDEETIDKGIAYLQSLKAYLPAYNSLLAFTKQGADIKAEPKEEAPAPEADGIRVQEEEANSQPSEGMDSKAEPLPDAPAPLGLIGWLERAWDELGRPKKGATGEEIFNSLLRLGFVPTARHPQEAIKTALRINPRFRKVGEASNKAALWKLKPRSETSPKVSEAQVQLTETTPIVPTPINTATKYKGPLIRQNPRPGERVIDYAVRAWKFLGRGTTTEELAQAMKDHLNWQSTGDPVGTLSATLRKPVYQDVFKRIDGLWFLQGENVDGLPSGQLGLGHEAS